MSEKYDYKEDRDNDVKNHDNGNHESHHSYTVHLEETEDEVKNWQQEDEE